MPISSKKLNRAEIINSRVMIKHQFNQWLQKQVKSNNINLNDSTLSIDLFNQFSKDLDLHIPNKYKYQILSVNPWASANELDFWHGIEINLSAISKNIPQEHLIKSINCFVHINFDYLPQGHEIYATYFAKGKDRVYLESKFPLNLDILNKLLF